MPTGVGRAHRQALPASANAAPAACLRQIRVVGKSLSGEFHVVETVGHLVSHRSGHLHRLKGASEGDGFSRACVDRQTPRSALFLQHDYVKTTSLVVRAGSANLGHLQVNLVDFCSACHGTDLPSDRELRRQLRRERGTCLVESGLDGTGSDAELDGSLRMGARVFVLLTAAAQKRPFCCDQRRSLSVPGLPATIRFSRFSVYSG